ncbi:MAG: cyclic nucleotide-binding domain-containing protein [Deltaproteobacteria bacterium]|jgi:CRP-like cAMP-binding protein|nr:cyclic nucleotide-binding domain-containing protein [Deltaproteobacteria bacterium]
MDEQGVIEKLRKIKLFHTVKNDEERLTKLARIVTWQQCKAGVEVLIEGTEGSELYILQKGTVRIIKRILDQERYTIVTLKDDEDAFFGELALLDREVRSASVLAETDCEFLVINREDFNQLGEEDPRLGLLVTRAIAKELSKRLRKANQDMILLFEALVEQVAESGGLEEG